MNLRAGAALAALALFGCHAGASPEHFTGTALGSSPAPDFRLTDQNGHGYRLSERKGHEVVLFFGYTHCPDECPMTMAHLAAAARQLPAAQRERLDVDFITVDPARDDPATLRRYVRAFDPRFFGLTGSAAELDPVYKAYHVWAARLPSSKGGAYREAHDSHVFLIDPEGRLRVLHGWQDSTADLATDMRQLLAG